jgi:hypothetical protein
VPLAFVKTTVLTQPRSDNALRLRYCSLLISGLNEGINHKIHYDFVLRPLVFFIIEEETGNASIGHLIGNRVAVNVHFIFGGDGVLPFPVRLYLI